VGRHVDAFLADYHAGRIIGEHAVAAMAERAIEADKAERAAGRRQVSAGAPVGVDPEFRALWPLTDDDDDLGEFAGLWPPRTPEEAEQRRITAARAVEGLSDDELFERLFDSPPARDE
jgi:hypothetical protein